MLLSNILIGCMAILPTALAQMSGYYNISSAMPTLRYLSYDSGSRKIVTLDRAPYYQQWFISYDGNGYAFIANRLGAVLTAVNGNTPGNLDLEQAAGQAFAPGAISGQSWKLNYLPSGFFEIESMKFPGSVLDVKDASTADRAQVLVHPRNGAPGTANQRWRIAKTSIEVLKENGW